jgi:hypothetical protein
MHLQEEEEEEGDQHPFSLTRTKNIPSSCVVREGGCGLGCFLNVYFLPLGLTWLLRFAHLDVHNPVTLAVYNALPVPAHVAAPVLR